METIANLGHSTQDFICNLYLFYTACTGLYCLLFPNTGHGTSLTWPAFDVFRKRSYFFLILDSFYFKFIASCHGVAALVANAMNLQLNADFGRREAR